MEQIVAKLREVNGPGKGVTVGHKCVAAAFRPGEYGGQPNQARRQKGRGRGGRTRGLNGARCIRVCDVFEVSPRLGEADCWRPPQVRPATKVNFAANAVEIMLTSLTDVCYSPWCRLQSQDG